MSDQRRDFTETVRHTEQLAHLLVQRGQLSDFARRELRQGVALMARALRVYEREEKAERARAFDAGARAVDEHIEGCEVDPREWKGEAYLAARRKAIEGGE